MAHNPAITGTASALNGGSVVAVVFSPDGTRVATGSDDDSARVFEVDGALIQRALCVMTRTLNTAELRRYSLPPIVGTSRCGTNVLPSGSMILVCASKRITPANFAYAGWRWRKQRVGFVCT
jgi:hypothetical protein